MSTNWKGNMYTLFMYTMFILYVVLYTLFMYTLVQQGERVGGLYV